MSDVYLFRIDQDGAKRLEHSAFSLERELQRMFEQHLQELIGVKFLRSEWSTDATYGGRIDTVGIDENFNPVIVEYKRGSNDNVINQGLFYLDWLVTHKADFKLLVLEKLGQEVADSIDWSSPRLICIAEAFNRYDAYAVRQMNRNIQLLTYRKYPDGLFLLELVTGGVLSALVQPSTSATGEPIETRTTGDIEETGVRVWLSGSSQVLQDLFSSLSDYILSLGDDIQLHELKHYFAFRKLQNVVCVQPLRSALHLFLKLNPDGINLTEYAELQARNMRQTNHLGTGDLKLVVSQPDHLELAKPLIEKAYLEQ